MTRLMLAAVLLIAISGARAADWKYYGNTAKVAVAHFYDADSVERPSATTVRVWTKSISQQTLYDFYTRHSADKEHIDRVAEKMAAGYVPGFYLLPQISSHFPIHGLTLKEVIMEVTMEEIFANTPDLSTSSKVYFAIDCKRKSMGILSAILYQTGGGIAESRDTEAPEYHRVPPDTPAEWLLLLVCPTP